MTRREPATFRYSLPLEEALTLLFGMNPRRPTRWQDSASMFCERKNVSRAVQEACKRLRSSLDDNIIADERLTQITRLDLEGVERSAKEISNKDGAVIDCIGYLIKLVGHLLGHDGDRRGKPWRYLFYVYTMHRDCDFSLLDPKINPPVYNKRVKLINQMWKEGDNVEDIASVMNLASRTVESILIRIRDAEKAQGIDASNSLAVQRTNDT